MLFHSQGFILIFLPLVLAAYYATARRPVVREWVLLAASLVFYSWWDVRFLPVLLGQATATWGAVVLYRRSGRAGWLWAGVAVNLASLIAFKYTVFLAGTIAELLGRPVPPISIVLPIGISFFTFQLACYLVDVARGDAHVYPWRRVTLFVSLFPHLIAGPIVRHHEIMPAARRRPAAAGTARAHRRVWRSSSSAAPRRCSSPIRWRALPIPCSRPPPPRRRRWWTPGRRARLLVPAVPRFLGLQRDGVGLGLHVRRALSRQFRRPYRAADLAEFWRRWHITLSKLIRDYLYIPLGGSRHGRGTYVNATLISMGLCGLWHGAGWTFVAWGAWHGPASSCAAAWQKNARPLPAPAGWGLTVLFVLAGWVLFRSPDFTTAAHMLAGLAGQGSGLAPTVAVKPILAGALLPRCWCLRPSASWKAAGCNRSRIRRSAWRCCWLPACWWSARASRRRSSISSSREIRRMWLRFLLAWTLTFSGAMLAAAVAIALIDPLAISPLRVVSDEILPQTDRRYLVPAIVRGRRYDSYLIGTSTIHLFDPKRFDDFNIGHFANLSLFASTPYEQVRVIQLIVRKAARCEKYRLGESTSTGARRRRHPNIRRW